ncbi:MAG: hypothetical protein KAG62_02635 [Caulobacter sp.]|nr:hypothetical protein [Caulobacter sp.]
MASHRVRAIAISLAVALAPMGAGQVWAQNTPAPTAASLQTTIAAAAQRAASQPGFARLSASAKLAAIQASISAALAATGASPTVIAAALVQAVGAGTVSAGVAIQVAAAVAPEMTQTVASAPVVTQQLAATGQSATVTQTAATTDGGAPSVLVSLQGVSQAAGGDAGAGAGAGGTTTTTTPAPYDPCAGVVAAYCG